MSRRGGLFVFVLGLGLTALALNAFGLMHLEPSFHAISSPFQPPSLRHWFGTDDLGRDLFQGVVLGARLSLLVGISSAALALGIGTTVGVVSGYAGGRVDDVLLRVVEFFQVLPRFFVALTVLTLWDARLPILVLVLGLTSWSGLARLARAEAMSLRERDFVVAARASGASGVSILWNHVLPGLLKPLVAATPLIAGQAMLTEAGLSFLGIGVPLEVSWGYLLQNAQPFLRQAWWMAVFPGIAITATVLALSLASLLGKDALFRVLGQRIR
jgi:peptide/nickel transport system permease protein